VTGPHVTVRHVTERDVVIPGVDGNLSGVLFEPDGGAALEAAPGATKNAGLLRSSSCPR
jgi:hypothetical protein